MGDSFQDEQQMVKEIERSLTPDQRSDVLRGAVPITFSAFAQVSVQCNSGRDYHSRRKTRRYFVGRFIRLFEKDLELESPEGASQVFHQYEHPGRKVWRSVAVPRSRQYSDHGDQGTGLTMWGEQLRHSPTAQQTAEGWGKDVDEYRQSLIEDEGPQSQTGPDAWEDEVFPEAKRGDTATTLPSRWAHAPNVSDRGYQFARHILRPDGSVWFRLACPCGFRTRELSETEIANIFDQLAENRIGRITVQELLGILDTTSR